jgi:NADH dehydrogenase (ubiquinone) 1 beta subcomplex subunit 9
MWASSDRSQADASHQELIKETEALLEKWKHPDPYRAPTAPGGSLLQAGYVSGPAAHTAILTGTAGSKYERNLPCPILDRECRFVSLALPIC